MYSSSTRSEIRMCLPKRLNSIRRSATNRRGNLCVVPSRSATSGIDKYRSVPQARQRAELPPSPGRAHRPTPGREPVQEGLPSRREPLHPLAGRGSASTASLDLTLRFPYSSSLLGRGGPTGDTPAGLKGGTAAQAIHGM
jgi:hypothetical protein